MIWPAINPCLYPVEGPIVEPAHDEGVFRQRVIDVVAGLPRAAGVGETNEVRQEQRLDDLDRRNRSHRYALFDNAVTQPQQLDRVAEDAALDQPDLLGRQLDAAADPGRDNERDPGPGICPPAGIRGPKVWTAGGGLQISVGHSASAAGRSAARSGATTIRRARGRSRRHTR